MKNQWPGHYLDGNMAERQIVTVTLSPTHISIARERGEAILWALDEVKQTQGFYENEPVRIERGDDRIEALIVEDPSFIETLHRISPSSSGRFGGPSTRGRKAAYLPLMLAGAVLLVYLAFTKGVPLFVGMAAEKVPPSWEAKLGKSVEDQFMLVMKKCEAPQVDEALDGIVKRLIPVEKDQPYTFKLNVVRNKDVNALAAPGGYIFIFSGLLEKTESPEELAGVVAHEMQHVLKKHATRKIINDMSTGILISLMFGGSENLGRAAVGAANTLNNLSYSRELEEEADRLGMEQIQKAGIDPAGMIRFFEKLEKEGPSTLKPLRYISTHPLTGERIVNLQRLSSEGHSPKKPLHPDVSWKEIAGACGGPDNKEEE